MDKEICATCKKPKCISDEDRSLNLDEMPGWSFNISKNSIDKTFRFDTFVKGIDFVSKVADVAEEYEHHPDISINYTKVTISLSTHDLSCISNMDFEVAKKIDTVNQ